MIDVNRLYEIRENSERIEKQHGVINHKLKKEELTWILDELGYSDHTIVGGNFFTTPNPFHIHTDNGKDNGPDFNILIPMNEQDDFYTVQFFQQYDGPASHFWVGSLYKYFPPPVYNEPKKDYNGVYNLGDGDLDITMYKDYLSHLPYESVKPLTIRTVTKWHKGIPIEFPCNRLHCSAKFDGVKEGLTLLVKRPS